MTTFEAEREKEIFQLRGENATLKRKLELRREQEDERFNLLLTKNLEITRLKGVIDRLHERLRKFSIESLEASPPAPDYSALQKRVKDLEIAVAKLIGRLPPVPEKCDWCKSSVSSPHYDQFGKQNVCKSCFDTYCSVLPLGRLGNCFYKKHDNAAE